MTLSQSLTLSLAFIHSLNRRSASDILPIFSDDSQKAPQNEEDIVQDPTQSFDSGLIDKEVNYGFAVTQQSIQ